jgi:hypothetical protein
VQLLADLTEGQVRREQLEYPHLRPGQRYRARVPLGFVGAEGERVDRVAEPHRLRCLEGWLDHLISLGCNGLLLGPVFSSSTHGYDTTDYFSIDHRLGDGDDFDRLVAACHRRGIRVLLDGVFNHAGQQFPPVAQALAEGPDSPSADWVSRLHTHAGVISADYFEGHDTLVTLNHRSPRVQQFVRDVMLHWLRRGIDAGGWTPRPSSPPRTGHGAA